MASAASDSAGWRSRDRDDGMSWLAAVSNNIRHNEHRAKIGRLKWRAAALSHFCAAMLERAQRTEEGNAGHLEGVPTRTIFSAPTRSHPSEAKFSLKRGCSMD